MPISKEQLSEWKRLCEEAAPAPWIPEDSPMEFDPFDPKSRRFSELGPIRSCDRCPIATDADGRFVLAARTALPALIERVEELEAFVQKIGPWGTRNAAENTYCVFCGHDDSVDRWSDQRQHVLGCEWVKAMGDE
jgi:hypothetical protein